MAHACTKKKYEFGSPFRVGATEMEIPYDLVATGGTTTGDVRTPFKKVTGVLFEPKGAFVLTNWSAVGGLVTLTYTANAVGTVRIRGVGQ